MRTPDGDAPPARGPSRLRRSRRRRARRPGGRAHRRPAAAAGRVRQLPQAASTATARPCRSRRRPRARPSCCRCSTTSTGPRRTAISPARSRRWPTSSTVVVQSSASSRSARSATRSTRRCTRPSCTTGRGRRADGADVLAAVLRKGYRMADRLLRPAMVGGRSTVRTTARPAKPRRRTEREGGGMTPAQDWIEKDFYRRWASPRTRQRRDQEGVPQARPRAAPGQEPGRRQGRGAVQGGLRGLRRAVRRRRSARSTTRPARCSRRRRRLRRRRFPAASAAARRRRRRLRHVRPVRQRRGRRRQAGRPVRRAVRRHLRRPVRRRRSRQHHGAAQPPGQRRQGRGDVDFERGGPRRTLPLQLSRPAPARPAAAPARGRAPRRTPARPAAAPGFVSRNQGAFGFSEPCRDCRGTGQIIDDPCPSATAPARRTQTRTITVRDPGRASRDGAQVRLAGKGTPGHARRRRPVTCSSPCTSARTRCSAAPATT